MCVSESIFADWFLPFNDFFSFIILYVPIMRLLSWENELKTNVNITLSAHTHTHSPSLWMIGTVRSHTKDNKNCDENKDQRVMCPVHLKGRWREARATSNKSKKRKKKNNRPKTITCSTDDKMKQYCGNCIKTVRFFFFFPFYLPLFPSLSSSPVAHSTSFNVKHNPQ